MPPSSSMFDLLIARKTLAAAFERVRDRGGCHGADGMTVGLFDANREAEIDRLQSRLMSGHYHPFPLLRFEVRRRDGRQRP